MELILTPVINFGEVRMAQLAKSTLLTSTLEPMGFFFFRSFKICSDTKETVGCGNQREATAPIIPSKTASLVSEFAMEDLPLVRTVTFGS